MISTALDFAYQKVEILIRGKHSWFEVLTRNTFYFIIFWKLWKLKCILTWLLLCFV